MTTPTASPALSPWLRPGYIGALALLALGITITAITHVDPDEAGVLATLAVSGLVIEIWGLSLYGDSRVSLSFGAVAAGAMLGGMSGAALVALGAGLGTGVHQHQPQKLAFNLSVLLISGAAMGAVGDLTRDFVSDSRLVVIGVTATAGTLVNFGLNSALVATVIGLSARRSPLSIWVEKYRWLAVHYLAIGAVGIGMGEGYRVAGIPGLLLFLIPAAMQRVVLEQYVRRTRADVASLTATNSALKSAHGELSSAHQEVSGLLRQLEHTYDGTLIALVNALDARDTDTRGHSERVGRHTRSIAILLGIAPDSELGTTIYRGALLHDVGKIGVRDGVLLKPGKLTAGETAEMREHPRIGHQMLKEIPFLAGASEIILAHHEQWDGLGYPNGLRRDEVPLGARLFSVADCFDAMMSDRPYRAALSLEQTLAELRAFRGTQFDPEAVDAVFALYLQWMTEYPNHPEFRFAAAA